MRARSRIWRSASGSPSGVGQWQPLTMRDWSPSTSMCAARAKRAARAAATVDFPLPGMPESSTAAGAGTGASTVMSSKVIGALPG